MTRLLVEVKHNSKKRRKGQEISVSIEAVGESITEEEIKETLIYALNATLQKEKTN